MPAAPGPSRRLKWHILPSIDTALAPSPIRVHWPSQADHEQQCTATRDEHTPCVPDSTSHRGAAASLLHQLELHGGSAAGHKHCRCVVEAASTLHPSWCDLLLEHSFLYNSGSGGYARLRQLGWLARPQHHWLWQHFADGGGSGKLTRGGEGDARWCDLESKCKNMNPRS